MFRFVLVVLCGLSFSCSGFNKPVSNPVFTAYDSEFLYWCKQEMVWPVYIDVPADCEPENISRGAWDHYPVTVNAEDNLLTETLEAIEAFNAQVGFELFRLEYTNLDPDVVILDSGFKPWLYAEAKRLTVGGREYGAVLTYNDLGDSDRSDVIMHELGHIVGLRHDRDNPKSLMYHTDGLKVAALEAQDIKALRMLYLF